jgi:hypothetical protein
MTGEPDEVRPLVPLDPPGIPGPSLPRVPDRRPRRRQAVRPAR